MENIMRHILKFDVECPMISEKSKTEIETFLEKKAGELNEKGKNYYCFTFLIIGNVDEVSIAITILSYNLLMMMMMVMMILMINIIIIITKKYHLY